MAKAKLKLNGGRLGREFEVAMSFELRKPDKELLPKRLEAILVMGETAYEDWFYPDTLERHLKKGYLKPPKKKRVKAKAAH
jgi:hypothetical protein